MKLRILTVPVLIGLIITTATITTEQDYPLLGA